MDRDDLLKRVGDRVRARRALLGLTAREAARRSDLSLRFYGQLESGKANIAIGRLAAVADALGLPLADLVAADERASARPTSPAKQRSIALLGLRGAGKSTLGARLAQALGLPFVELDDRIEEAAGLSLAEIFALHGESYYRRLAADCLADVLGEQATRCVIALPGGIVQDERAFDLVRRRCNTVWLKARPKDHAERVIRQGDARPMAGRPDAMAELRAILAAREPLYSQADVTIDTSRHDPDAALALLRERVG